MFTYDPQTDRGRVRLLIHDTDVENEEHQLFTDEEVDAFLALEDQDVYRATAQALDVIATRQALVLKVIRLLDLQTDGAKVAAELRAQAKELRARAEDAGEFDWSEMVLDQWTLDERLTNEFLREG